MTDKNRQIEEDTRGLSQISSGIRTYVRKPELYFAAALSGIWS
jgi:hypothetical protein